MTVTQQEQLRTELDELIEKLGPGRSSLIPILQEVKRRYRGVDDDAMQVVADALDIHPVEVYSVASFYAFLHGAPQGRYAIRLCQTLSCESAGKQAVADALTDELGIGFDETTDDGLFTLEWASCVGMCDQGPALLVNDEVHTRVTPASVREIVAGCRASAERDAGWRGHRDAGQRAHLRDASRPTRASRPRSPCRVPTSSTPSPPRASRAAAARASRPA